MIDPTPQAIDPDEYTSVTTDDWSEVILDCTRSKLGLITWRQAMNQVAVDLSVERINRLCEAIQYLYEIGVVKVLRSSAKPSIAWENPDVYYIWYERPSRRTPPGLSLASMAELVGPRRIGGSSRVKSNGRGARDRAG